MEKYYKYIVIILVVIIAVSGFVIKNRIDEKNTQANASIQFAEVIAKKGNIKISASGDGNLTSSNRKEVKPDITGTIEKVYVSEGDYVNEGDLLLTVESESEDYSVEKAKLNLSIEEKTLKEYKDELNNLKVYAPASGVVGDITAQIGSELNKGYLFTTITDKSKIEITGMFNESQVSNIKEGDKAEIFLSDSMSTLTGDVIYVSKISTPGENGGVFYEVNIETNNPGGIKEGSSGEITIINSKGSFSAIENKSFKSKDSIKVNLSTSGNVKNIYVSKNDNVQKGDLLLELESPSLLSKIESQEIKVEQKRLELNDSLKKIGDTAIYAPTSGIIINLEVEEGDTLNQNKNIATISDLSNLELVIQIDELDISKIKSGQETILTSQAFPSEEYKGVVEAIAYEGSSNNGIATFDVTIKLDDIKDLRPGMTVNAEIVTESRENVLLLPIEAVQLRGNKNMVMMKSEETAENGMPNMVPVEIGLVSEDYVEIISGVNENDVVVYAEAIPQNANVNMQGGMGMNPFGGGNGGTKQRPAGFTRPQGGGN